jgi:hypothetical protein
VKEACEIGTRNAGKERDELRVGSEGREGKERKG